MNLKQFRMLSIGLVIVFVAVAGYFALQISNRDAMVGNFVITKQAVKERVWFNTQFSGEFKTLKPTSEQHKVALDQLIELALLEIQAEKSKITIKPDELAEEIKSKKYDFSRFSADQKRISEHAIRQKFLKSKVAAQVVVSAESQDIVVPFFRYFFSDKARYESDKAYAKKLADEIYNQLKAGTITVIDARKKAHADPRVGAQSLIEAYGYTNYSYGGGLTKQEFGNQESSAYHDLLASSKNGINEPKIWVQPLVDPNSPDADKPTDVPASWLIVFMRDRNDGTFTTYQHWLTDIKKNTKIQVYQ